RGAAAAGRGVPRRGARLGVALPARARRRRPDAGGGAGRRRRRPRRRRGRAPVRHARQEAAAGAAVGRHHRAGTRARAGAAGRPQPLRLWDATSGQKREHALRQRDGLPVCLAASADGRRLALAMLEGERLQKPKEEPKQIGGRARQRGGRLALVALREEKELAPQKGEKLPEQKGEKLPEPPPVRSVVVVWDVAGGRAVGGALGAAPAGDEAGR